MANGVPKFQQAIGGNLDWVPVASGDFNHNGAADVIWRSTGSGTELLWSMGYPQS